MPQLRFRLVILVLLVSLIGCGGGISEGIPPGAGQALTPEQQKEHDDLVAQEEAAAKAASKGRRGP